MKRQHSSDHDDLALRISKSDAKAFRIVYDNYIDRVAGFIFSLIKSHAATEELLQECFIKLWSGREHLRHVQNMESYLFSIAKNTVTDHLRKLYKDTKLRDIIQHTSDENHHRLHEQDLQRIINEALSTLGPEKRKIFSMSKVAGMTHDEIAEALHLSKSTVKNHLSESLKHLRDYVSKHPESGALILLAILAD